MKESMSQRINAGKQKSGRVLVVDDHPIVRLGVASILDGAHDLECCGGLSEPSEVLAAVEAHRPDLVIADLRLGESSGLTLLRTLQERPDPVPVLVLSMHDETVYAERALQLGARGYVMKGAPAAELLQAVRAVLGGNIYLSAAMTRRIVNRLGGKASADEPRNGPLDLLTNRELEVFELLGQGHTIRTIAKRLALGVKTVETHRQHIKEKLNVSSSTEVVRRATLWVESGSGDH